MVFFTSILIVFILYYLQADGLIYVTIVAVTAELINIFLTQTLTKSVEQKAGARFKKVAIVYKNKINLQKKTIEELENIQEKSATKIYNANIKIKEYEEKLGIKEENDPKEQDKKSVGKENTMEESNEQKNKEKKPGNFLDLPPGSDRKELPI